MKKTKFLNSILFRYFICYFIVFTIAFFGILLISYSYFMPKYAEEIQKNAESRIHYIVNRVNEKINNIGKLTYKIGMNKDLEKKIHSGNSEEFRAGTDIIKSYMINEPVISGLFIRFENDLQNFYNSEGSIKTENLIYDDNLKDCKTLIEDINKTVKNSIVIYNNKENSDDGKLVMISKSGAIKPYYKGVTVVYLISDLWVRDIINELDVSGSCFEIRDENGDVWISSGKRDDEKKRVKLIEIKSELTGLYFKNIITYNDFFSDYTRMQVILFTFIILSFVVFIFVALKLSKLNAHPINEMLDILEKDDDTDADINEISKLKGLVYDIVNRNVKLENALNQQNVFLIRSFLLSLIRNGVDDEQMAQNIVNNLQLDIKGKGYSVAIIPRIGKARDDSEIIVPVDLLEEYVENKKIGYLIEVATVDYLILMICSENRESTLKVLQVFFEDNFNKEFVYFIGDEYEQLKDVHLSFFQALKKHNEYLNNLAEEKILDDKRDREVYFQIMKIIEENYTDNLLSLDMIAEKTGKSIYYISRAIKSNLGSNFSGYVSGLRLELAKKLLRETDLKVNEIVTAVGYIDSAAFNKKFKAIVGCSPGAYRKMNKDKKNKTDF